MKLRRVLELLVVPALFLGAMIAPVVVWQDRLPDQIAAHWGIGGAPDRGDAVNVSLWLFLTIWVTAWIAAVLVLHLQKMGGRERRWLVAGWYWFGGLMAGLWVLGLTKSLDVSDWQQAGNLPAWQAFALMLVAFVPAALGYVLAGGVVRHEPDRPGHTIEPMHLPVGEAAVWSGTATNPKLVFIVAIPILVISVIAVVLDGEWWVVAFTVATMGIVAALTGRASATVGPDGVRARLGPFAFPGKRIPLDQIAGVTVENVQPMAYGGWGWRLRPGAQAFIVRCGPGLRIARKQGSDIVVTVDDADRGAAVLAGYLETAGRTGA